MTESAIKGVFNIVATPFDSALAVDFTSLHRLVEFQLDKGGPHGLTTLGVLSEVAKLSVEERKQIVQTVMETAAGRIPVVVGTSHAVTASSIALSRDAFAAGDQSPQASSPITHHSSQPVRGPCPTAVPPGEAQTRGLSECTRLLAF